MQTLENSLPQVKLTVEFNENFVQRQHVSFKKSRCKVLQSHTSFVAKAVL